MRHLFIAGGSLLLGMSIACNPIKELDPDTPAITSGDVIAHFTSANESKLFQADYIDYSDDLGNFTIQLKPDQTYQEIDGFGAALTGSAACLLTNEMDASSKMASKTLRFRKSTGTNSCRSSKRSSPSTRTSN